MTPLAVRYDVVIGIAIETLALRRLRDSTMTRRSPSTDRPGTVRATPRLALVARRPAGRR